MNDIYLDLEQYTTENLSDSKVLCDFLSDYFSDDAEYVLEINRNDEDAYIFNFDRVKTISSNSLTTSDVMNIVPTGSYWSYFLGWRDIFGIPISSGGSDWLAFGVETVLTHESRGAFLYLKALFLPLPLNNSILEKLELFADKLFSSTKGEKIDRVKMLQMKRQKGELKYRKTTNVATDSKSIVEHGFYENWIINQACQFYRKRKIITFRTLAMKKSQQPFLGESRIIGTVNSVSQSSGFQD